MRRSLSLYLTLLVSIGVHLFLAGSAVADALNILPSSNDLWDVTRANPITIINSSEAMPDFPVSKIFGASDAMQTWTIFADGKPPGYVDFVEWKTSKPINLSNFNFWATRFDYQNRPTGLFSLYFSDNNGQSWTKFFEKDISNDYAPNIGIAEINAFSPSFLAPVEGKQYFRAEFVRINTNGPAIHELDGFGKEVGEEVSPSIPAIDTTNYGVAFWSSSSGASLDFYVRIIDFDGIPSSTSHSVFVSYPGTVTPPGFTLFKLSYASDDGPYAAYFKGTHSIGTNYTVPNGNYVFTVIDPDGNVGQAVDQLAVNPLPVFDNNSLTPSNYGKTVSAFYDNVYIKRGTGNYTLYDNFNSSLIDTSLWTDKSSGGGTITVSNGEAFLNAANALQTTICNLSVKQDPLTVNGIQTDVRVTAIESGAYARIAGYFLSLDNRNIWSKISIGTSQITYNSEIEYPGQTTTYEKVSSGTLVTGDFRNKPVRLSIDWDELSKVLTYSAVVDGISYSATYSPPGVVGTPTIEDKRLDSRLQLVVPNTCPTITWSAIPGANSYRVRIFSNNGAKTLWTSNVQGTSFKVPPGVLKANSGYYQYQITAWDSHTQLDIDSATRSQLMNFWVDNNLIESPFISSENLGVNTFNDPDDGLHLNFYVRISDANGVPEDIKRVKVIFPDGITEKILFYNPGEGDPPYSSIYSGEYYGNINSGIYTFHVEDWEGNTHQMSEELVSSAVPYPTLLSPQNGDVLDITKLPIRWSPVSGAAFYRVFIYDLAWNTVIAISTTETELTLPEGFLQEETMYRIRVIARGEFQEQNVDNSSQTSRATYAANVLTTPITQGTGLPVLNSNGLGVFVWKFLDLHSTDPFYWLTFEVKVLDPDGVPANIESVKVKYPGPTGKELVLLLDHVINATEAVYWHREAFSDPALIPTGIYTFTVTDFDGNSHQLTDTLTINPIPLPTNLRPADGEYIIGTTPTIDWDDVPGAIAYQLKVYKGYDANTEKIFDSMVTYGPLTQSECSIPAGFLLDGWTYSYRVYAYREDPLIDADNRSSSPFRTTERPQFTVMLIPDNDNDGIANSVDTLPTSASDEFSDGQTFGRILSRNGQIIKVTDLSSPEGVLIAAGLSGVGDPAEVSVCGGAAILKLNAGDNIKVTCGSVTAKVVLGEVEVKFVSSSNSTATAVLEPGRGLSYDPISSTFAAPADNTGPVAVVINNEVISVGQGTATKIVRIDIKPGTNNNIFNPDENGVLPVAILGSSTLNVQDIVLENLLLQGLNLRIVGRKCPHYLAHYSDINQDGFIDLIVQFEDSNNWQDPGSDYARLTGTLKNGMLIEGMDLIVIVHNEDHCNRHNGHGCYDTDRHDGPQGHHSDDRRRRR
jgi:hypothetical protein